MKGHFSMKQPIFGKGLHKQHICVRLVSQASRFTFDPIGYFCKHPLNSDKAEQDISFVFGGFYFLEFLQCPAR
jgi:hypothetical protein